MMKMFDRFLNSRPYLVIGYVCFFINLIALITDPSPIALFGTISGWFWVSLAGARQKINAE